MMDFLSRIIQREVGRKVSEVIAEVVPRLLDEKLPPIIDRVAAKTFAEKPSAQLTEAGFGLALSLALREFWPQLGREEASKFLCDYIEVPYGTKGYDWTPAAAKEIACAYVADFGEHP